MAQSTSEYKGAVILVESCSGVAGTWRVRLTISRANDARYVDDFNFNFPQEWWALVAGIAEAQRIVDASLTADPIL